MAIKFGKTQAQRGFTGGGGGGGGGGGSDIRVKVSATDTTTNYLAEKLSSPSNALLFQILNGGGDEEYAISTNVINITLADAILNDTNNTWVLGATYRITDPAQPLDYYVATATRLKGTDIRLENFGVGRLTATTFSVPSSPSDGDPIFVEVGYTYNPADTISGKANFPFDPDFPQVNTPYTYIYEPYQDVMVTGASDYNKIPWGYANWINVHLHDVCFIGVGALPFGFYQIQAWRTIFKFDMPAPNPLANPFGTLNSFKNCQFGIGSGKYNGYFTTINVVGDNNIIENVNCYAGSENYTSPNPIFAIKIGSDTTFVGNTIQWEASVDLSNANASLFINNTVGYYSVIKAGANPLFNNPVEISNNIFTGGIYETDLAVIMINNKFYGYPLSSDTSITTESYFYNNAQTFNNNEIHINSSCALVIGTAIGSGSFDSNVIKISDVYPLNPTYGYFTCLLDVDGGQFNSNTIDFNSEVLMYSVGFFVPPLVFNGNTISNNSVFNLDNSVDVEIQQCSIDNNSNVYFSGNTTAQYTSCSFGNQNNTDLSLKPLGASNINFGKKYLEYKALLTQSGVAAPVPTVIVDEVDGVNWSYGGVGDYGFTIGYGNTQVPPIFGLTNAAITGLPIIPMVVRNLAGFITSIQIYDLNSGGLNDGCLDKDLIVIQIPIT